MKSKGIFVKKKNQHTKLIIQVGIFLLFVGIMWVAFGTVGESNQEQEMNSLISAIDRASIYCYANEGAYPSSIEYLEENYGLQINHDKYIVHYDSFATNIKPDITVIRK